MTINVVIFRATGQTGTVGYLNNSIPRDVDIGGSLDIPADAVAITMEETTGTAFRFGIVADANVALPAAPNSHRLITGSRSFAVSGPAVLKTATA